MHQYKYRFDKELPVYQRLSAYGVRSVNGFAVPRLINFHPDLQVIELSIVRPPYVLDFVSSYLDQPPDFPPEHWEDWYQQIQERFEERWEDVIGIFNELKRRWGIYHLDLNPGNVNFGNT